MTVKLTRLPIGIHLLPFVMASLRSLCGGAPLTEEDYWKTRGHLQPDKYSLRDVDTFHLTSDEAVVDRYLRHLRSRELRSKPNLIISPIEDSLPHVLSSDLFKILQTFPKGGNMHIHENHMLPRGRVLDIVWSSEEFQHLYILPESHPTHPWTMDFFLQPPEGEPWVRVKGHELYTKEMILRELNYVDMLRARSVGQRPAAIDSVARWNETGLIWSRLSRLLANVNIKRQYTIEMMSLSLQEGVQYLETKKSFTAKEMLYTLDADPEFTLTHGKRYLEGYPGEKEVGLVRDLMDQFKLDHPDFLGFRRLAQSVRHNQKDVLLGELRTAFKLHDAYPDVVAGFDMAGEEDRGYSALYHREAFLQLQRFRETHDRFHLVCHAGETSSNGDGVFTASHGDLEGPTGNLYHAVAHHASRIGHGLGLMKEPTLWSVARARPLPIEVCPICNHMLGFVPDLRNHPALSLMRFGVPVVLGSDAHGALGSEFFTVDWFMVFMAWDLTLQDLRTLATNSFKYSLMPAPEKSLALSQWEVLWDAFIARVKTIACDEDNKLKEAKPEIYDVIPQSSYSAEGKEITRGVNVAVYGRGFESAICGGVLYRYGDTLPRQARYLSESHISCPYSPSPSPSQCTREKCLIESELSENGTQLFVSFDGGKTYIDTLFNLSDN